MTSPAAADPVAVAFVCVENAGRSQMAAAFAARERARRGLEGAVDLRSGGTDPAAGVHGVAVEAMAEVGIDLSDARPREIARDELADADVVVTMGCSVDDVCPATWRGDARDWGLADPKGRSLAAVRPVRDEIETRVGALFDELQAANDRA